MIWVPILMMFIGCLWIITMFFEKIINFLDLKPKGGAFNLSLDKPLKSPDSVPVSGATIEQKAADELSSAEAFLGVSKTKLVPRQQAVVPLEATPTELPAVEAELPAVEAELPVGVSVADSGSLEEQQEQDDNEARSGYTDDEDARDGAGQGWSDPEASAMGSEFDLFRGNDEPDESDFSADQSAAVAGSTDEEEDDLPRPEDVALEGDDDEIVMDADNEDEINFTGFGNMKADFGASRDTSEDVPLELMDGAVMIYPLADVLAEEEQPADMPLEVYHKRYAVIRSSATMVAKAIRNKSRSASQQSQDFIEAVVMYDMISDLNVFNLISHLSLPIPEVDDDDSAAMFMRIIQAANSGIYDSMEYDAPVR